MVAIVPLILAIIGALCYALSNNGKAQELGRIAYAAGLFALAFAMAGHVIKVL